MLIANDIVDFKDCTHRKGFEKRVLSDQEYLSYLNAKSRFSIWYYWTAKETAYKLFKQLDPNTPFLPKQYIVNLIDSSVTFKSFQCKINHILGGSYLFCFAFQGIKKNIHIIDQITSSENCSLKVREMVSNYLSTGQNFHYQKLNFKKNLSGQPILYSGNFKLPYSLSFTHHGNFIAGSIGF